MDFAQTAALTGAARSEPDSVDRQMAAARHLLEQRLPAEALPFIERASELACTPELAALAGTVAVTVGDLKRAVRHFHLQLERDPSAAEAHANLGLVAAAEGDWVLAADRLGRAVAANGSDADWQNDLGVARQRTGDPVGAEAGFLRARALVPTHRDAAINLADLYEQSGRAADAFGVIADYLRFRPDDRALAQRKRELLAGLPAAFRAAWVEPPLDSSVYDDDYFQSHLGTEATTRHWQQHRGRRLDPRFCSIVQLARAGAEDEVLDLGCGRGELAYHFAALCRQVVAVDYSAAAVAIAREVCGSRANVEVVRADAKEIEYDGRFAVAFCTDVAEHLYPWELEIILTRLFRALKPGGQLILQTPVHGEVRVAEGEEVRTHVVAREVFDFPVHVNVMTMEELRAAVVKAGFAVEAVRFDGKVILSAVRPAPALAEPHAASGRPRGGITFFASNDAFLGAIRAHLETSRPVRIFTGGSRAQMERELQRAELAWFEWCDDFLVAATQLEKRCPIVCRLHSYEAFTDIPERVDWGKVDGVIFVNESVRELMSGRIPADLYTAVIPNGLDFDRYRFRAREPYGKKVAFAGYLNFKKNPGFLLACFEALHRLDPEFTFHVAGRYQGAHIQVFLEHLLPRLPFPVRFHGWVEDMPRWLEDKDYILSTSYFESFHYSVAEGIASGLLPLVYDWRGSENCYPAEVRFRTLDECVRLMDRYRRHPAPAALARRLRADLKQRFDLRRQLDTTDRFLERILAAPRPQAPSAGPAPELDTRAYWETRLSERFDLRAVGQCDMGEAYNRAMYRLRRWRIGRRLADLGVAPAGKRILDLGSGTGFFVDFWRSYGPQSLDALDFTATAVARLRERFADVTVHEVDFSAPGQALKASYDIISAFDVLFHIVDDDAFARALEFVAGHLAPGGLAVLTVGYTLKTPPQPALHYRARTEAEYRRQFERLGLEIVTAEPLFVAMNAPVDAERVRDGELRQIFEELWGLSTELFGKGGLSGRHAELAARWALLHEQIHLLTSAPSPSSKLVIVRKGG